MYILLFSCNVNTHVYALCIYAARTYQNIESIQINYSNNKLTSRRRCYDDFSKFPFRIFLRGK